MRTGKSDQAGNGEPKPAYARYLPAGVVATALLISAACVDRSLNPWFPETDRVFENGLLGKWIAHAEDETDTMSFTRGEGNLYRIDFMEKRESREAKHGFYEGRLGRIDGVYYLDYQPAPLTDRGDADLMVRAHGLARLDYGENKLRIRLLNSGRMEKAAKEGKLTKVTFAWIDDEVLLTSGTQELRRLLLAHAGEEDFFDPKGGDFVREK